MKNISNQKLNQIYIIFIGLFLLFNNCQNVETNSSKFDLERLNQIDNLINTSINSNSLPGAVVLVAKDNRIVYKSFWNKKSNYWRKIQDG